MQIHWEKVSNGEPAIGHSCILWWDEKTERDLFNKEDEELYINDIDNSHVYEWLKSEIPLFECSDKDIERT